MISQRHNGDMSVSDTVLIVDDSSFIVDGLVAILKKKYRTLAAYSGEDCLAILGRETPSIIILDVMMEPIDGWETLTRIRENAATRWTPVLMFSARKLSPEDAEKHLVRLDDFILKPVSPKKIIESIEKVLARRNTNKRVIETWKAAGAGHVTIEEYLTLTTSLEVDLSLCQNMRLQYDLASPTDGSRTEFRSLMAAIEARIGLERSRIAAMELEMNALLETSSCTPGEEVPEPGERETGPCEPPGGVPGTDVFPGIITETLETHAVNSSSEDTLENIQPEVPVPAPVVPEKAGIPVPPPGPPHHPPTESSFVKPPPTLSEEDELFEGDSVVSLPGDELFEAPAGFSQPGPVGFREKIEGVSSTRQGIRKVQPAAAGEPCAQSTVASDLSVVSRTTEEPRAVSEMKQETSGRRSVDTIEVRSAAGILREPPGPDHSGESAGQRHLVPAELDIPPELPDEILTGAGTDVPMHREQVRGRKRAVDRRPVRPGTPIPHDPATQTSAGGIISRIIALFIRKKQP